MRKIQFNRLQTTRSKTIRRLLIIIAVFLICVLLIVWINPFNDLMEWLLVYETPLENADVVLLDETGGILNEAVRLYREGYANKILVTRQIPEQYRDADAPVTKYHFVLEDLRKANVPEEDILILGGYEKNMLEEQKQLREFIHQHGIRSYIIQPLRYHSRLEKMVHDDTFPQGDVKLIIWSTEGQIVPRKHILGIHNTIVRMLYWRFIHRPSILRNQPVQG